MTVGEPGPFAGELEHRLLGCIEVGRRGGVVGAAVLALPAEDELEEAGRDFVVLFVGSVGDQRDRGRAHRRDKVEHRRRVASLVAFGTKLGSRVAQALAHDPTDTAAEERFRHKATIDECEGELHSRESIGNRSRTRVLRKPGADWVQNPDDASCRPDSPSTQNHT